MPQIFRLGGLFRDFRNVRDLVYLLFVKASPYFNGTLTTKWNDVEPSIQFLIHKGVLNNDAKSFFTNFGILKRHESSLINEEAQRLLCKPAVGQVF